MINKRNTLVGPQLQRGFRTALQPNWKRASGFLAAILLGAIVATQMLANSFHYHPSLGLNLFHIYPPWNYFVWSHLWSGQTTPSLPKRLESVPW